MTNKEETNIAQKNGGRIGQQNLREKVGEEEYSKIQSKKIQKYWDSPAGKARKEQLRKK